MSKDNKELVKGFLNVMGAMSNNFLRTDDSDDEEDIQNKQAFGALFNGTLDFMRSKIDEGQEVPAKPDGRENNLPERLAINNNPSKSQNEALKIADNLPQNFDKKIVEIGNQIITDFPTLNRNALKVYFKISDQVNDLINYLNTQSSTKGTVLINDIVKNLKEIDADAIAGKRITFADTRHISPSEIKGQHLTAEMAQVLKVLNLSSEKQEDKIEKQEDSINELPHIASNVNDRMSRLKVQETVSTLLQDPSQLEDVLSGDRYTEWDDNGKVFLKEEGINLLRDCLASQSTNHPKQIMELTLQLNKIFMEKEEKGEIIKASIINKEHPLEKINPVADTRNTTHEQNVDKISSISEKLTEMPSKNINKAVHTIPNPAHSNLVKLESENVINSLKTNNSINLSSSGQKNIEIDPTIKVDGEKLIQHTKFSLAAAMDISNILSEEKYVESSSMVKTQYLINYLQTQVERNPEVVKKIIREIEDIRNEWNMSPAVKQLIEQAKLDFTMATPKLKSRGQEVEKKIDNQIAVTEIDPQVQEENKNLDDSEATRIIRKNINKIILSKPTKYSVKLEEFVTKKLSKISTDSKEAVNTIKEELKNNSSVYKNNMVGNKLFDEFEQIKPEDLSKDASSIHNAIELALHGDAALIDFNDYQ